MKINSIKNISYFCISLFIISSVNAQDLRSYTVKKTNGTITIDGVMDEPEWEAATLTEPFVEQEHGYTVNLNTQAKMLWNDQFLYILFLCDDDDAWSTFLFRDDHLWEEENVEIFCDPDGDKHNYFELEFNPLGTIFDQVVDRSWMEGNNNENRDWNIDSLAVAVSIDGTINNASDTDTRWYCEVAIPFDGISNLITPLSSPPQDGDEWRLQLARYNRYRDNEGNLTDEDPEQSVWNQTDCPYFHVPAKFGRIIFSGTPVSVAEQIKNDNIVSEGLKLIGNYPNPFKNSTEIQYSLSENENIIIDILNINGQVVETLCNFESQSGTHSVNWNSKNYPSGVYICRMQSSTEVQTILIMSSIDF